MNTNTASFSTTFTLGGDLPVNRIGYGTMRLTGQPGNFGPYREWESGRQLLQRAIDLGINFIDTAEAYGPGFNEELIASALHPYPKNLVIATKGGINKPAPDDIRADGRPENLRRGCEESLQRLKLDRIDLYQLHRPDPNVPLAESVGMLAELQREGKIRHIGLSNVTIAQIKIARQIAAIASVQNRFSFVDHSGEDVLNYCTQNHIAFIPWGPLGANPLKPGSPLVRSEGVLADMAARHSVKPNQIALLWLLHRAPNIILIPGTTAIAHLEENAASTSIALSAEDIAHLRAL
jgi:aryl-alcohol dehydrogenase-like predicted oxidoreductase